MTEKEIFIFTDPSVEPSIELLSEALGEKLTWWMQIRAYAMDHYPHVTDVWRYYNDGKQWLYRMLQKKNTICWMTVVDDTFKVTFYFGQKAIPAIMESTLSEEVKQEFLTNPSFGKIKYISVRMTDKSDVELVHQLVDLKVKIK